MNITKQEYNTSFIKTDGSWDLLFFDEYINSLIFLVSKTYNFSEKPPVLYFCLKTTI